MQTSLNALKVSTAAASSRPDDLTLFSLRVATDPIWVRCVLGNLDDFLLDHAACEKKASSQALSLVARYPDRWELVDAMLGLAKEELEHFHVVVRLLHQRGLTLQANEKDPYINILQSHCRHGDEERLLDRLVLSSVVEARGFERLVLLVKALANDPLGLVMERFMASEAGHRKVFLRLAERYFPREEVHDALEKFLDWEAEAISQVPIRPAFH